MYMKEVMIAILCIIAFQTIQAQSIPPNTCGILYTYDNAGNRIKREYYCNNNGRVANEQAIVKVQDSAAPAATPETSFQVVDALYPNPTTGIFYIRFGKSLENAIIHIIDNNGKVIQQMKASGTQVTFDLSSMASGVYFVRINDGGNVILKKVIKSK